MSDHGMFSSYEGQQGAVNGQDSWDVFQGCTRFWTAGCLLVRRLHKVKVSTTMNLAISMLLISA